LCGAETWVERGGDGAGCCWCLSGGGAHGLVDRGTGADSDHAVAGGGFRTGAGETGLTLVTGHGGTGLSAIEASGGGSEVALRLEEGLEGGDFAVGEAAVEGAGEGWEVEFGNRRSLDRYRSGRDECA